MPRTKDHNTIKRAVQETRLVRTIVSQTAWLDGAIRLLDDRLVFEADGERVALTSDLLAQTQRRINEVRRYSEAARQVVGDIDQWIDSRKKKLEFAKSLKSLDAKNLEELARKTKARDKDSRHRMLEMLWIEALCIDTLPVSPTQVLASTKLEDGLFEIIDSRTTPEAVRAQAALAIGAVHSHVGKRQLPQGHAVRSDWIKRCYNFSLNNGLSADPSVLLRLLEHSGGTQLAARYCNASKAAVTFPVSAKIFKERLQRGGSLELTVKLVEVGANIEPLAAIITDIRDALEKSKKKGRNPYLESKRITLEEERKHFLEIYQEFWSSYIERSGVTENPESVQTLLTLMINERQFESQVLGPHKWIAQAVLDLTPIARTNFLDVLIAHQDKLWHKMIKGDNDKPHMNKVWGETVYHLCRAARRYDKQLMHELVEADLLAPFPIEEATQEQAKYLIKISNEYNLKVGWVVSALQAALEPYKTVAAAQKGLDPLLQTIATIQPQNRAHFLEIVSDMISRNLTKTKVMVQHLTVTLPLLIQSLDKEDSEDCVCMPFLQVSIKIHEKFQHDDATFKNYIDWLNDWIAKENKTWTYMRGKQIEPAVLIALEISNDSFENFKSLVSAMTKREHKSDDWLIKRGLPSLKTCPALHEGLRFAAQHRTKKFLSWMENLGLASLLKTNRLQTLDFLKASKNAAIDESWVAIISRFPQFEEQAHRYINAARTAEVSVAPPKALLAEVIDPCASYREEIEFLQRAQNPTAAMKARIANLKGYLADEDKLTSLLAQRLKKTLFDRTPELEWKAAENLINHIYMDRLLEFTGALQPEMKLDSFLLNAIFLTSDVTANRRLLKRLLKAEVEGDTTWRDRQPGNIKFLKEMTEKGFNSEVWMRSNPKRFHMTSTDSDVHLKLENRPLHILEMGNYFDTCLAVRGCNSFATVANACEFNKRVIYAIDDAGRVIGRKLIAINDQWELLGFHTYTSLSSVETNKELREIFNRYCREFAQRCGLSLGFRYSHVPSLFAKDWYNDGVIDWDSADEKSHVVS